MGDRLGIPSVVSFFLCCFCPNQFNPKRKCTWILIGFIFVFPNPLTKENHMSHLFYCYSSLLRLTQFFGKIFIEYQTTCSGQGIWSSSSSLSPLHSYSNKARKNSFSSSSFINFSLLFVAKIRLNLFTTLLATWSISTHTRRSSNIHPCQVFPVKHPNLISSIRTHSHIHSLSIEFHSSLCFFQDSFSFNVSSFNSQILIWNSLLLRLVICLVLVGTLIEISHTRSTAIDDNADENSVMKNYFSLNDHLTQPIPFDNDFYPIDDFRLNKRIIMLPRVGRRSIQTTS